MILSHYIACIVLKSWGLFKSANAVILNFLDSNTLWNNFKSYLCVMAYYLSIYNVWHLLKFRKTLTEMKFSWYFWENIAPRHIKFGLTCLYLVKFEVLHFIKEQKYEKNNYIESSAKIEVFVWEKWECNDKLKKSLSFSSTFFFLTLKIFQFFLNEILFH